ncbi:type II secretion system protein GspL [Variovorax sp. RB2P76]|uniref:type II secretion system protein GspL n=1 Tax=Variovorax sp. RB2P76 TaxID=3443736 RepID=UPI003F454062
MMRVDLLRLMLPPARHGGASSVRCAWRTPQGAWQSETFESVELIAGRFEPKRVEVCPHPADVAMTDIELPPLPVKRQRIAVLGVVELLALSALKNLTVGFGPRTDKGTVPVAWMSADVLSACLRELHRHGLPVHAVLPPPAFLPDPKDESWVEGTVAAIYVDDWAVVRTGTDGGALHPGPTERANLAQMEAKLQPLLSDSPRLHWLPLDEAVDPGHGQVPVAWTGTGWTWALPTGKTSAQGAAHRWLRPAVGWAGVTVVAWLLGLNLYASQVAAQGQTLTRQMAAQVKAAFPDVSVVLNPLQQARQLRDARKAGGSDAEPTDFGALARASAALLTQAEGQVQSLDFEDGQLRLRWREGARPSTDELKTLQGRAHELGLAVQPEDGGLRIQVTTDKKIGNVAASAAAAPPPVTSGAMR